MKPNFKTTLIFLLFASAFTLCANLAGQNQIDFGDFLQDYRNELLPEKVYVHTDKNIYAAGETIWMALYLVDGQTHIPGTLSSTIHIELHSANGATITNLKVLSDKGHASASMLLPSILNPGPYRLYAYTQYQRNSDRALLFKKEINIVPGVESSNVQEQVSNKTTLMPPKTAKSSLILRFFPEGGECVEGILCKVAVVAENASGKGIGVSGLLIDGEGKHISELNTNEYGVGIINYIPNTNSRYFGTIDNRDQKFEIQPALKTGYHLSVVHAKNSYKIIAKTNVQGGLKGARILLHIRGILLLDQVIENDLHSAFLDLPDADLFPGVITATLFDPNSQPVGERLFFVAPSKEESKIDIRPNKPSFSRREDVEMDLFLSNIEGAEFQTDSIARLSYSVVPENALDRKSESIVSWLLLNSDLEKRLSISDSLFYSGNRLDEKTIDDLMRTRGWRRFAWQPVGKKKEFNPEYLVEGGIYLLGKMGTYENKDKARPGKVFLTNMADAFTDERMTDEEGDFVFGPYMLFDTIDVRLEGRYKAGKKNRFNEKITVDDNAYISLSLEKHKALEVPNLEQEVKVIEPEFELEEYEELSRKMLTIAKNYDSLSIVLDVVNLEAKRIVQKKEEIATKTAFYQNQPSNRIVLDSLPEGQSIVSVIELLRRIPGLRISGPAGSENIIIRGFNSITLSNEPSYFFDGFQVDLDFIRNYPVANIEFIDVLKGPRTSIFGAQGSGGVILIYSRSSGSQATDVSPGRLWTKMEGYQKRRVFPVFDSDQLGNQNRLDIRTTVFWNPLLYLDKSGKAKETFKSTDQIGTFHIIAQGLRADGTPIFGRGTFNVGTE